MRISSEVFDIYVEFHVNAFNCGRPTTLPFVTMQMFCYSICLWNNDFWIPRRATGNRKPPTKRDEARSKNPHQTRSKVKIMFTDSFFDTAALCVLWKKTNSLYFSIKVPFFDQLTLGLYDHCWWSQTNYVHIEVETIHKWSSTRYEFVIFYYVYRSNNLIWNTLT